MGPFKLIRGIRKRRKKEDDDDDDEEEGGVSFPIIDRPTPVKDMLSGMSKRKKKSSMNPASSSTLRDELESIGPKEWREKVSEGQSNFPIPFIDWVSSVSKLTGISETTIKHSRAAFRFAKTIGLI